jgi:four helix bundle protein
MKEKINSYQDLRVFQNAMEAAMKIFQLTTTFPREEKYSMTDHMRAASRSVCSNLAGAWRKRLNREDFVSKLNDSEGEACETLVWVEFARKCKYLEDDVCDDLNSAYDLILRQLVKMINEPDKWLIKKSSIRQTEED